jgi:hypothetical protein
MKKLQFPVNFLDAVKLENDDTIYYVVGLFPSWENKSFIVWLMTDPNGIETWAYLHQIQIIKEINDSGKLPFINFMKNAKLTITKLNSP